MVCINASESNECFRNERQLFDESAVLCWNRCPLNSVGSLRQSDGPGNLFAQHNFKKDARSDFRSCILTDLLERFLGQINLHRSALNRITFNIVSSTQVGEYIKAQQDDPDADCDSMILISICYGKQTIVSEERGQQQSASADGMVCSSFENEIILSDVEQPKHLLVYDHLRPRSWRYRSGLPFTIEDHRQHESN